ncbi:hypothetical protein ATANTOWER_018204 [Ataeniobius toweri]|uniref:Uncharacterized protein n=1 Tax=Ataeniobius toweri TaxID=208326 RepID=A0ABU7CC65_9TELE|nr:hypothetical protein [Ataeniobius toweri]
MPHNHSVQILQGSLDQLPRMVKLYLHANHFSTLSEGIFDKPTSLETITLGDNPGVCKGEEKLTRIPKWALQTHATVLGCPCHTTPMCGQSLLAPKESKLDSAPLTESPYQVNSTGE